MLQNDSHLNCLCVMARLIEALAILYHYPALGCVSLLLLTLPNAIQMDWATWAIWVAIVKYARISQAGHHETIR